MDSRGRPAAAGELMAQDYRYIPLPASAPPGGYRATAARREQARLQREREAAWRRESEGLGMPVPASRNRPVGPVRDPRSEAERLDAVLAEQARLSRQTPTDRLIGEATRRAAPTTLAQIGASPEETSPVKRRFLDAMSALVDDPSKYEVGGGASTGGSLAEVAGFAGDIFAATGAGLTRGLGLTDAFVDPDERLAREQRVLDGPMIGGPSFIGAAPAQPSWVRRGLDHGFNVAADIEEPDTTGSLPVDVALSVASPENWFGLGAAKVATGAAGWFPKRLAAELTNIRRTLVQRAKDSGEKVKDAVIDTAVRNHIRDVAPNAKVAQRLIDGYETIALPTTGGVNFDQRRPLAQVMKFDAPGTSTTSTVKNERGVVLSNWSKQRMDIAYDVGGKRNESWGDGRWLFNLSDGDPETAVIITRLLGSFSPRQKTDANALNAIEAFLRASNGETTKDIIASQSFGHPLPNTVTANMDRAMQLGRIFQQKTEALAGAELGLHDAIPIDMWLLRALGVQSDTTPGTGAYRLLTEAVSKEAASKGESPFSYMAKVWMGMQDIVGTPTPSFSDAVGSLGLTGTIGTPAGRAQATSQIGGMAESMLSARRHARAKTPNIGVNSPVSVQPKMPYDEFLSQAQALMRRGIAGGDVLGRVKTPQGRANVSLRSLAQGRGAR